MGLDIIVNTTKEEVLDALQYEDCGVKDRDLAISVFLRQGDEKYIGTRPGSYGGLHVVREKFITLKGIDLEPLGLGAKPIPESHKKYHLLNHSDCDGWYLPDDFEEPVWAGSTSIGSSPRLLAELEEITPASADDWYWRWEAVYVAAVASVVCNKPIRFC